jgi:hypothetical protein
VTEPSSTAPAGGRIEADAAALRDELEECRKEVLRLRDLVIGREAELGAARGRVAELSAELTRYAHLESRLDAVLKSNSWRIAQTLGAPLRALRRRKA